MSWQQLGEETFELGESPFWHPHEQTLYWVDIPGKKILRANVYMGTVQAWDMPSEPGCIAPAASGGLVIALRHGVFRAREWGGALEHVVTLPEWFLTVINGLDGSPALVVNMDLVYADESRARIVFSDSANYAASTRFNVQPILDYADTELVTRRVTPSFTPGDSCVSRSSWS